MKSEKAAYIEFSNSLLAFIRLKQKNIFELGVNFNTLKYPSDASFCLNGLNYFYDNNQKAVEKNVIRGSNFLYLLNRFFDLMGEYWINNCFKDLTTLMKKVEVKTKNYLELKSQFSELEYKIVLEARKQQSRNNINNSNKKKYKVNNNSNKKQNNFSISLDIDQNTDETTTDQTKYFNCDQSSIVKDHDTTKFSIADIKIIGSSEDSKLKKKESREIAFTCYNDFSSNIINKNNNNENTSNNERLKNSIEKTNEKFLMSLKESKFETLFNIANLNNNNQTVDEYNKDSELNNPYYIESENYNQTVIYKMKKPSISKTSHGTIQSNISISNENCRQSIQYITINALLKILLARNETIYEEISEDFDINQLAFYLIQQHISFIDTSVLFSKVVSILKYYSERLTKLPFFIYFIALVIHNSLVIENRIEKHLLSQIKKSLITLTNCSMYKEKTKISSLRMIIEEIEHKEDSNVGRKTVSSTTLNSFSKNVNLTTKSSKKQLKSSNIIPFESSSMNDNDSNNNSKNISLINNMSNLSNIRESFNPMRNTQVQGFTKQVIEIKNLSKLAINNLKSIFENNSYDFTFIDKLTAPSKSFDTISEVSEFSFNETIENSLKTKEKSYKTDLMLDSQTNKLSNYNNNQNSSKIKNLSNTKLNIQSTNNTMANNQDSSSLDTKLKSSKINDFFENNWYFDILEWSGFDIARQLTLISYEIYNKIKPSELVNSAWTKVNKKHITSPNVLKLIDRFNSLYLWIIEEILSYDMKRFRYKVIEKFIVVALYLKEMRNYNDLVVIVSALNSYIIKGLEKTLLRIGKIFKDHWIELTALCSYDNNYACLRKALNSNSHKNNNEYGEQCIGDLDVSTTKSKNLFNMLLSRVSTHIALPKSIKKERGNNTSNKRPSNLLSELNNNYEKNFPTNNSALPYLGILLRDLSFSGEGSPLIKNGIFINIERIYSHGKLINDYLKYQNSNYYLTFESLSNLNFLRGCKPISEEELYNISNKLEPKFILAKNKREEKRPTNTDFKCFYLFPDDNECEVNEISDYTLITDYIKEKTIRNKGK